MLEGSSIVIAAAEGIVTAHDRTLLVQYGGHINLTHNWALSLLSRMGTAVMKELSAQWLTAMYDNFRGRPELITNGFIEGSRNCCCTRGPGAVS